MPWGQAEKKREWAPQKKREWAPQRRENELHKEERMNYTKKQEWAPQTRGNGLHKEARMDSTNKRKWALQFFNVFKKFFSLKDTNNLWAMP